MQKMVKPIRLVVLAVVFVLLLGVYFVALYKLQIIGGREYYAVGETETKEDITIAAARGIFSTATGVCSCPTRSATTCLST